MWGARAGSGGDRLGSVELMRTAQRRLGQAGRRPFGPEPGSDPGAVWPPTWAGQGRQLRALPWRVESKFLAFTTAS